MDADNKMSHVCRTCLEQINDINYVEINDDTSKIKDQLVECVPELNLNLVPNAYLCIFCAQALQNAYDFKQKCLQTEEIIRNHVRECITPDLEEIKQEFKPYESKYDVSQTDLGMEIIYIKDDDILEKGEITTDYVHSFLEDEEQEGDAKDDKQTGFESLNSSRLSAEELRLQSQVKYSTKKDNETMFCCSQCNFKTSRSFLLKQHKVTHKEAAKPNATVPKIKHNGLKQYTCYSCPFKTSKKMILKNHQQLHKEYACDICNFKTYSSCGFSSHLKTHGIKRSSLPNDDLKLTIKVSKKQNSKPITVIPENNYKCTKCNYATSNAASLQKHYCTHSYNCKLCDFVCADKNKYFKHLSIHKGLKLKHNNSVVTCPKCPYKVNRRMELKYHLTLHTGNRQYKCSLCTFNATRDYFLQKHMSVHSEDY